MATLTWRLVDLGAPIPWLTYANEAGYFDNVAIATPPADDAGGPAEWKRYGERHMVPSRFQARIRDRRYPDSTLDLAADSGRIVCTRIECRSGGAPASISADVLTRLPLRRFITEATAVAAVTVEETPDGRLVGRPSFVQAPDAWRAFYAADRLVPKRGIPVDDEHYRKVAEAYRDAIGRGLHPTKFVMESFSVSRSTAGRWVAEARRRGLLPETTPRKALA